MIEEATLTEEASSEVISAGGSAEISERAAASSARMASDFAVALSTLASSLSSSKMGSRAAILALAVSAPVAAAKMLLTASDGSAAAAFGACARFVGAR